MLILPEFKVVMKVLKQMIIRASHLLVSLAGGFSIAGGDSLIGGLSTDTGGFLSIRYGCHVGRAHAKNHQEHKTRDLTRTCMLALVG